jgi:amidase
LTRGSAWTTASLRGFALALLFCASGIAAPVRAADPAAAPGPEAANVPRLRALDFTPFEPALARFPALQAREVDALLRGATIPQVQAALAAGRLTSEALALYFLERIRRHDERLRTYLELNPAALDEARAADARRKAGRLLGPLDGIPVSLKDNIETAPPMHTTAGSALLLDTVAKADAPLVARLRAQGAVILGKANLSEFAGVITLGPRTGGSSAVGGQTMNPHGAPVTGGSSAGSAAATAARLAMASIGSETSGSLVAPSAWNGVVGLKPGRGVVDGAGIVPLLSANDTPGPVARSVTDAAILLDAIALQPARFAAGLRRDALAGVPVAVLERDILEGRGNAALLERARKGLAAAGAVPRPTLLPQSPAWAGGAPFVQLLASGMRLDMMGYVSTRGVGVRTLDDLLAWYRAMPDRRAPFGLDLLAALSKAPPLDRPAHEALVQRSRESSAAILDATFEKTGARLLVSLENMHATLYATAGYPAITVPLGLREGSGTPAGVTFIGRRGEDGALLAMAYAFEQATRLRVEPRLDYTVRP